MRILLVIVIALMMGCQTLLTTGKVTTEAIVADAIIESGAPLNIISSANLSDDEIKVLILATDRYKEFKRKWKDTITDPIFPSYMLAAFSADFANLTWHYKQVENVAVNHWDEYDAMQQALLVQWKDKAYSLAESTKQMIDTGARNQALTNALDFGLLLLKMRP